MGNRRRPIPQAWKQWTVEGLPCLEQLSLSHIKELEGMPSEIGEIATLEKIWVQRSSAKAMVEEQMDCQGDELSFQVEVRLFGEDQELKSLSGPNFTVFYSDS